MEVEWNWASEQLDRYRSDSERVVQQLEAGAATDFFLQCSLKLLFTYLRIHRQASPPRRVDDAIVRLARMIHPYATNRGYWNEVSSWWPELVTIAGRLSDATTKAAITRQLAITRNDRGETREAQRLYEKLTSSPDYDLLPSFEQADILHQAGVCYLRQGNYVEAKEALERCLSISDQHNYLDLKGCALNQLGNLAMFQGNWTEARRHYDESLKVFEVAEESENLGCIALQGLGRLFVLQGYFSEAILLLEKGLAIRRRRQEELGTANNAIHLATAYLGCDRFDEAEHLLNEALQICKALNDRRGVALCYWAFSHFEIKQGNRSNAISQCQQALEILRVTPMPSIEVQVLEVLLPQLLRAGRIRELALGLARLISSLQRQKLGPSAIWRLGILAMRRAASTR